MDEVKRLKKQLLAKTLQERRDYSKGLSTGNTILNLACSGKPDVGFLPGSYYYFVGDSNAGKTWVAWTCLAEATINPIYKNYRIIFDDVEGGSLMDLERYFGHGLVSRIESPGPNGRNSDTIEEFYDHLDDAIKVGKPFLYVLDSFDGLSSESERAKAHEQKNARRKDKKVVGSFGDGKAKKHSSGLRQLMTPLRETGSILLGISQTRDNIDPYLSKFNPKTRSGGNAPEFYAAVQIWYSIKEHIKREVLSKDREIGIVSKVKIKRNRITGLNQMTIYLPILYGHGIDETGSMVRYLVDEGVWKGDNFKGTVVAKDFAFDGKQEDLVKLLEGKNKESLLRTIVMSRWDEVVKACAVERKSKYRVQDKEEK